MRMLDPDPCPPDDVDSELEPGSWIRLSRRDFARGALGTAAVGALAGCRPCFPPQPPRTELEGRRGPRTYTVRVAVKPGEYRKLRDLLDDRDFNPFESGAGGIHYARLFTANHAWLYFMIIYDDYWNSIAFLGKNAKGVDRVFQHCVGYPDAGAANAGELNRFIDANRLCVELFYRAYDTLQPQIRNALVLRDHFLHFLQSSDGRPDAELRSQYARFLADPHLRNTDRTPDNDMPGDDTASDVLRLQPSAPDRVNPFTMLAPVHPSRVPKLRHMFAMGTWLTIDMGGRPLAKLPTLHFARVSMVDGNNLLFASVYDGDFVQYVEDFSSKIAKQMDRVFGACIGYPAAGSADVFAFKEFLRARMLPTNAFGGAYLNRSVLQIKSSLALTKHLGQFSRRVGADHPRLPAKLTRFLHDHQHLLT